MTYQELYTALSQTGLPLTYYAWNEDDVPNLPYLVYYFPLTDNVGADNKVYQVVQAINVELYTAEKDFDTEQLVESVLDQIGLFWNKSESYLTDEHMYEVLYESEEVINYGSN